MRSHGEYVLYHVQRTILGKEEGRVNNTHTYMYHTSKLPWGYPSSQTRLSVHASVYAMHIYYVVLRIEYYNTLVYSGVVVSILCYS